MDLSQDRVVLDLKAAGSFNEETYDFPTNHAYRIAVTALTVIASKDLKT